jgi:hypothetical protein
MENYLEHAVQHRFQFSILNSQFPILALVAEDLERFVEDRATTNATTFVMLDLRLWDASVDTYSFRPIVDSDNPIDQ